MKKILILLSVVLLISCGSSNNTANNESTSNETVQEVATPEPTPEIKKVKKMLLVREDNYSEDNNGVVHHTNITEYKYDEKGRMIWSCTQVLDFMTGAAPGCSVPYTYEYNDENQLVKKENDYSIDSYTYEGDNLVQEASVGKDNPEEITYQVNYKYNESNQVIEKTVYSFDRLYSIVTYEYDEDGDVSLEVEETYPFGGPEYGTIYYYNNYIYDEDKHLIRLERTSSDSYLSGENFDYEYNEDGLLVKRTGIQKGTSGPGMGVSTEYSYEEIEVEE